ncbi:MAG: phospholipid carrier-dependent glycosyltransferase [Candidatus Eremiobacteraeota bacterium]|nr:phospholipid carrier-dependent glycosyltransferase [Candidatus Eremiobacteraeota bacterium]
MSASSAKAQRAVESAADFRVVLWLMLAAAFVVRILFIGNDGFRNDVQSFEGWALTLASHPFSQFYSSAGFADYPPGYFYVLWIVGHLYAPFAHVDGGYAILKAFVKLPAILMDLVDAVVLFAIVRRFASTRWALGVAAFYLFNPAAIFISASWGQVDSIAGGLALLGVWLLLESNDADPVRARRFVVLAWLALGYSILIKPQAAILGPLFLTFAFVAPAERRPLRLGATALGMGAALVLAYLASLPFHAALNPVDAFRWLYERYAYGAGVYAYNSINAFNLWTIHNRFWQDDSVRFPSWPFWPALLSLPQYIWGIALVAAAAVLVLVRYAQLRTERALLEAAALLTLAFYMLSTRMHERYLFDGLLFTISTSWIARRYLIAAVILSVTLFCNLEYSLHYLWVMDNHVPGVDAGDMIPGVTRWLSLLNVAVFFWLGYVFLGATAEEQAAAAPAAGARSGPDIGELWTALQSVVRNWFDPREALCALRWPLDYALMAGLGAVSFVLSYIRYWYPPEKIFDEIYFARAAEEYLKRQYIYESTHPPLTKLLITLSTWMFGGLQHGDNAAGWRFLDVVFGALVVMLLFAFAKRVTRSTMFAFIAATFLAVDGMHFVQSRIATPEGFVVFFSLATLYCFYRYWIAAQVRTGIAIEKSQLPLRASGTLAALALAVAVVLLRFSAETAIAKTIAILYAFSGFYLLYRAVVVPWFYRRAARFVSYPEGTSVLADGAVTTLHTLDGAVLSSAGKTVQRGSRTEAEKGGLGLREGDLAVTYRKDGTMTYATPSGAATYAPSGAVSIDGEPVSYGSLELWLALFAISSACLVTSKWYGIMAYGAAFVIVAYVWAQRFFGRMARWGNPFGFRLDVVLSTVAFITGTIYFAAYTPQFVGLSDTPGTAPRAYTFSEVISDQYGMYEYHHNLRATHPYASVWWQWPLLLRPIVYYWKDSRQGAAVNDPKACCVAEVMSLPNPFVLWFGLLTVPLVAALGYREKNKAYILLVLAYLLQWLPWAQSPRISFMYHFYVDIPIICLCDAIILQRLWAWGERNEFGRLWARTATLGFVGITVAAFAFFYPVLAGVPLVWNQWDLRMWMGHWII